MLPAARELDASRIRGLLAQLEEALSQSDLVPAFDALVQSGQDGAR